MATISRHGDGWRVQIRRKGHPPLSATFPLKGQAEAWAAQRESDLVAGRLGIFPKHTLAEALQKFAREECDKRDGGRWEKVRITVLLRDKIAALPLSSITETEIADWRDRFLSTPSPRTKRKPKGATARRVMTLLNTVFELARAEWRWIPRNPMKGVRKPPSTPARRRGLRQAEIDAEVVALGYVAGKAASAAHQTAVAFLLSIETGMRSGELLALRWRNVHEAYAHLSRTKNGDARDVPLSARARELLEAMRGLDKERVFTVAAGNRDQLFRDARKTAGLSGFTFHDARSEAISRLSKKLDIYELARMVGHRDLNSLLIYYQNSAAEVAKKLG